MPSKEPSLATITSNPGTPVWAKTLASVSKMQERSLCAAMSTESETVDRDVVSSAEGVGGGDSGVGSETTAAFRRRRRMPQAAATTSSRFTPTS